MSRSRSSLSLAGTGLVLALLAGCGRDGEEPSGELSFERLSDTTGVSAGAPIVEGFEAYRMDNGVIRVKGRTRLPDGTNLRVAIKQSGERSSVAMVQVTAQMGMFDSPPIIGEAGPLPKATYVFEVSVTFLPEMQPPQVLRATGDGRRLRGPGMTRSQIGTAMFWMTQEKTL